jgi:S-formylglutathione hydrolase
LYFLSGLGSNHDNAPQKSGFARFAKNHGIAVVFPDTSPRNTGIGGIADDWEAGDSASYFVDATNDKTKQYFQMFSYINKELP